MDWREKFHGNEIIQNLESNCEKERVLIYSVIFIALYLFKEIDCRFWNTYFEISFTKFRIVKPQISSRYILNRAIARKIIKDKLQYCNNVTLRVWAEWCIANSSSLAYLCPRRKMFIISVLGGSFQIKLESS